MRFVCFNRFSVNLMITVRSLIVQREGRRVLQCQRVSAP